MRCLGSQRAARARVRFQEIGRFWLRRRSVRLHRGAYREMPSRRVYIEKEDGRQRPLDMQIIEGPEGLRRGRLRYLSCHIQVLA